MTGAAILAPGLLALGAAFCFAHAVGLLGIVVSVAGVVLLLGGNLMVAEKRRNGRLNSSDASETSGGWLA